MQSKGVYKTRLQTGTVNCMGEGGVSVLIRRLGDDAPPAYALFGAKNTADYVAA